jgi:alpha-tubulin suppressor-like RCC1 family protein
VYSFGKGSYCRLGHIGLENDMNIYEPKIIESLKNYTISKVSTGCRHAVAITDEGKVFSWGFNFYD